MIQTATCARCERLVQTFQRWERRFQEYEARIRELDRLLRDKERAVSPEPRCGLPCRGRSASRINLRADFL